MRGKFFKECDCTIIYVACLKCEKLQIAITIRYESYGVTVIVTLESRNFNVRRFQFYGHFTRAWTKHFQAFYDGIVFLANCVQVEK